MKFDFEKIKIGQRINYKGQSYVKIRPIRSENGIIADIILMSIQKCEDQLRYGFNVFAYKDAIQWFEERFNDLIIE